MQMQIKLRIVITVGFISLLFSCKQNLTPVDLYGTYKASYPYGDETLILNEDGTYQQFFVFDTGKNLKSEGNWEFRNSFIRLYDALIIDDGYGKPNPTMEPSTRYLWPIMIAGTVIIDINPDVGITLVRIKKPS